MTMATATWLSDEPSQLPAQAQDSVATLAGEQLVFDAAGCLYWPSEATVVVSDLHLEKGSHYARRGTMLPPYDTAETLRRLQAVLARWRPRRVISLGDSFHDEDGSQRLAPADHACLASMVSAHDWIWISGNHDGKPPLGLGGLFADTVAIGRLVLRHEPGPLETACGEVAGHLHPLARVARRGRVVRRRCFATDGMRLVMPAFGAFTGGLNLRDPAFARLFDPTRLTAHVMGRDRVHSISLRQLV